jgi:hypothetical protein
MTSLECKKCGRWVENIGDIDELLVVESELEKNNEDKEEDDE